MKKFLVLLTVTILIQCSLTASDQYETKDKNSTSSELSLKCRKRKSGHCKVILITNYDQEYIDLRDVGTEIPSGFYTKMKIEIDYLDKKFSSYKNDYGVNRVVEIILTNKGKHFYRIVIGEKFNHLAFMNIVRDNVTDTKFCNFSPELPTWPYSLEISVAKNGTVSVFETGRTEPFLFYEGEPIEVNFMTMKSAVSNKAITKLIGFYDCSDQPGCGTLMKQGISGCREEHSTPSGVYREFWNITNLVNQQQDILFSQSFAARPGKQAMHVLLSQDEYKGTNFIELSFAEHSFKIKMSYDLPNGTNFIKQVKTTRLNEIISSPFFLRLTITKDNVTLAKYSDVHGVYQILVSLEVCGYFVESSLQFMAIASTNLVRSYLHFDCCPLEEKNCATIDRKKYREIKEDEFKRKDTVSQNWFFPDGLTFNKTSLNTTNFSKDASDIYDYFNQQPNNACNQSYKDWCPNKIEADSLICTTPSLPQNDVEQDDYEDDDSEMTDKLKVFRLLVGK